MGMTDFDDEDDEEENEVEYKGNSDEDSFADAEEHVSTEEKSKLKPFIKEILNSTLNDSDLHCCGKSGEIFHSMSSKLVQPISSLVKDIVQEKLTSSSSKGITPEVRSPMEVVEISSEIAAIHDDDNADVIPDTGYDVFDLSMKRLDFIEHSFKTLCSADFQPPEIEKKED